MSNTHLSSFLILFSLFGFSQANLLNTANSFELTNKSVIKNSSEITPIKYAKVQDEDIIFSFTTWEVIDLDERFNFPFLYPTEVSEVTPDRKPLIHYLIEGARNYHRYKENNGESDDKDTSLKTIPAYNTDTFREEYSSDDFEALLEYKVLKKGIDGDSRIEGLEHFENAERWTIHLTKLGFKFPEEEWVNYDPLSEEYRELLESKDPRATKFKKKWELAASSIMPDSDFDTEVFEYTDVRKYVIKGLWYFERLSTELKYRPIAIGPIALSAEDKTSDDSDESNGSDDSSDESVDPSAINEIELEDETVLLVKGSLVAGAVLKSTDYDYDDEEGFQTAGQITTIDGITITVGANGVITSLDEAPADQEEDDSESRDGNVVEDMVNDSDKEFTPLFWVFYPDARYILSNAYAFNEKNMSKPFSFDRLINSRRFSATIYKEANIYQDRDVRDYIRNDALMQLLESERIKEKIRNKEQDMWSY